MYNIGGSEKKTKAHLIQLPPEKTSPDLFNTCLIKIFKETMGTMPVAEKSNKILKFFKCIKFYTQPQILKFKKFGQTNFFLPSHFGLSFCLSSQVPRFKCLLQGVWFSLKTNKNMMSKI